MGTIDNKQFSLDGAENLTNLTLYLQVCATPWQINVSSHCNNIIVIQSIGVIYTNTLTVQCTYLLMCSNL